MKKQTKLYDIRLTEQERNFLIYVGGDNARRILSRATEVNLALPENKEVLTDEKIKTLFDNKPYILYYNFDAGKWNSDKFMGHLRPHIARDTNDVFKMKNTLEKKPTFIDTEIIAVVVLSAMPYPGWGNLIQKNHLITSGKNIAVGALVRRDKKTGKIMQQPNHYIGIGRYLKESSVPEYAIHAFARDAIADVHSSNFAQTLNKLYKRQR